MNRADWKKIKKLILGNHINNKAECMIGDEGCKYLCESDWKNMTFFSLGIIVITKRAIKSELKAVSI